jgi:hypothetical protein
MPVLTYAGVYFMSIPYAVKQERSEWTEEPDTILLGAFEPSLTRVTMEIDCRECGRPVYVSPRELGKSPVVCILCGLRYFKESDRETVTRALIPQA